MQIEIWSGCYRSSIYLIQYNFKRVYKDFLLRMTNLLGTVKLKSQHFKRACKGPVQIKKLYFEMNT